MKKLLLIPTIFSLIFFSCSKNSNTASHVASFNIVNAVTGSSPIAPSFSDTAILDASGGSLSYGSYMLFSPVAGSRPLILARTSDLTQPFFNGTFNLKPAGIYSLFIAGDTTATDTLLAVDNIPYFPTTDSITGVRFVNLSKGGNPVSIDIAGTPNPPLMSSLAYKSISEFQSFPANSAAQTSGYTFEFRDAISDSLLASYSLNIVLNKSQTLAFYGNPIVGLNIMSINNY